MEKSLEDFNNIINASGFLFQLKIEDEIRKDSTIHGKKILATEYKWIDSGTKDEGFIDIILSSGTNGKMIVECKRTTDANWIFLVPKDATQESDSRQLWTASTDTGKHIASWDKMSLNPKSYVAMFCIVRGSGEKDLPMLERISSTLLRATESIAEEDFQYSHEMGCRGLQFYFPIIVTNATLLVSKIDSAKINLTTGKIEETEFEEVSFIKFTKSMTSKIGSSHDPINISESEAESHRTVYIINSLKLKDILKSKWEFYPPNQLNPTWPWNLPKWNED